MSTSNEAKQAAEWTYKAVAIVGSPRATRFTIYDGAEPITSVYTRSDAELICDTHNAATAKLREELDFIKTEHDILNARLHGEVHPKDNGDWHGMINIPELLRKMAEKDAIIMRSIPDPTDQGAIEQLAHQQPSAPTPEAGNHDCEYPSENEDARCLYCGLTSGEAVKYFEGLDQKQTAPTQTMDNEVSFHSDWEGRTPSTDKCCPKCGAQLKGDGTHAIFSPSCPDTMVSSPTPDVEKIARETAYELFGEDEAKHEAIAVLHKALAQARAPLVAELKNIAEADLRKWHKSYDTPADFMRWAQNRARSALTGIGEK